MAINVARSPVIEVPKPPDALDLNQQIAAFVLTNLYRHNQAETTQKLPSLLENMARRTTLAVLSETHVIGAGAIQVGPDQATFEDLVVEDGHARLGLGTKIVGALEERARGEGVGRVYVDSALTAIDFYKKLGYVQASTNDDRLLLKDLA